MARSLHRSVTYGLDASLALAHVVAAAGGRTDVDTLASALSYSGVRNGAFLTRLANARLFGLVGGRSGEVVLTDRGRRCLSSDPAVLKPALAEACWAVPLYHRVLEEYSGRPLGAVQTLTTVLTSRFGEDSAKAKVTARVLLESVERAGLLHAGHVDLSLVAGPITNFTDLEISPRRLFVPQVGSLLNRRMGRAHHQNRQLAGQGGVPMDDRSPASGMGHPSDEGGLWFDEGSGQSRVRPNRHRIAVVAGIAVCVALIAVPVGLVATSGPGPSSTPAPSASHVTNPAAKQAVLSALSATTSAGNFNVAYEFDPPTPPTVAPPSTTTTTVCHTISISGSGIAVAGGSGESIVPAPGSGTEVVAPPQSGTETVCSAPASSSQPNISVTGTGTVDTDPFAMLAVSNVTGIGKVTIRDDGTNIWEFLGTDDGGLAPGPSDTGPGQSLTGFAGLVESTLGQRQGALAMGGLASPTGYLDLDQSMISAADQTGTGTVDGVPVTMYEISISPAQEANVANTPGYSAAQAEAVTDAAAILKQQGYTGTSEEISVDASGYIRQTRSTAHFSDGSSSTSQTTFSDFGCAGTVLMPGQSGPTAPPAGCVSPDTGVAPPTTTSSTSSTTTTQPPSSSAATSQPSVTTVVPRSPAPTTPTTSSTEPTSSTTSTTSSRGPASTTTTS
jgi:hypothetical protein